MKYSFVILIALVAFLWGCIGSNDQNKNEVDEKIGMVVSAQNDASLAGTVIMEQGGNAFDAAIATHFALAVTYPVAGNLGGGGFAVLRLANGKTETLDFREQAPSAYKNDIFLDSNGNVVENKSLFSVFAAGIPGAVDGMWQLHQEYGSLDWATLLKPAIALATNGFIISKNQAESLNAYKKAFMEINDSNAFYLMKESEWQAGDTLKQPHLAVLLQKIQKQGRAGFYAGSHAEHLVEFVQEKGGLLSLNDLKYYKSQWRKPHTFLFDKWQIVGMPLPSSGAILMHQILRMIELLEIDLNSLSRADYVHLLAELERRAFADRSKYLGDPDFWKFNVNELVSDAYLLERLKGFSMKKASLSNEINPGNIPNESTETTHFSIYDKFGNAISLTTTINAAYGSRIFVPGYGYLLNNEMDDFSAKAGEPNMFGLLGSVANAVEGKKRPLSSMSPTLILKNDKLLAITGSPGGSTIITTVLQNIINFTVFEMDVKSGVEAPRFHHQWQPDKIVFEERALDSTLINNLLRRGHQIDTFGQLGNINAILILENGEPSAGADSRGENTFSITKK